MRSAGKGRFVWLFVVLALATAGTGCGAAAGPYIPSADEVPSASFNSCLIPPGQPTWANILLTGGRGPFHVIWSINGKVDSGDPQRTLHVPGKGTRFELRVTLSGVGQTFRMQVFNASGSLVSYSFTNTGPDVPCTRQGLEPSKSG